MDWKLHIAERRKRGWTLTSIASEVGCPLSTISQLARGASHEPRWSLGCAIRALPRKPPVQDRRRHAA